MIKILPSTTNCGCGYIKSKCAEIHYQTATFSILCIYCGMSTQSYCDFLDHFQGMHFADIQSMTEPILSNIYDELNERTGSKAISHHDPLEFEEKEVSVDPDDALKELQAKLVKTELNESVLTTENELQENFVQIEPMLKQFEKEEEQYLSSEVKFEPPDSRQTLRCSKHPTKNAITNPADDNSIECSISSSIPADCTIEENKTIVELADIDWTKPYEPTLLKNSVKRPYKPRNKPNVCSYCGRTFRRRYQLDTHLNIHTGLKPHQCEICGRQFRAITTLTRHLNTHGQRDAYSCKFCGKAFSHKAALLSHELRHTQERHIPCNECDKYFYTLNQMDTHKRKVHHKTDDDATLPFACDLCPKRYRSASMLSTHKFKKHYKSAKYSCEQCGKKFIDESQLEKHKLIHIDGLSKFSYD